MAISAGVHSNNKKLPLLHVRDRGDLFVLGLKINQLDRNVEIKSSAGSSPSSLVHFKHSQDWVIRGNINIYIELVARSRTGNPFRCAVTDPQLLRLMKSLSCHRTAHQLTKVFLVGPQSCYIIRLMRDFLGGEGVYLIKTLSTMTHG